MTERDSSLRTIDYQIVVIYLLAVFLGWLTIYSASYDYDSASIFSLDISSGKQLMWIGISIAVGVAVFFVDSRTYFYAADWVYLCVMVLLLMTVVIAPDTKGSHSWLYIGGLAFQPAELAKFATALALSKQIDQHGYVKGDFRNKLISWGIILLPVIFVLLQKETGSALVYLSLFIVLYREGMGGSLLVMAVLAVVYFIVGIKFGDEMILACTDKGIFLTLLLAQIVFLLFFIKENPKERNLWRIEAGVHIGAIVLGMAFAGFIKPFNLCYLQLVLLVLSILSVLYIFIKKGFNKTLLTILIAAGSVVFIFAVDHIFEHVLQPHQRIRIEVLLGMVDDPSGAGYNVNQAKISIGSGGFWGKGYLQGTQTKLKYVPEQDTDFIFCTVGEEFGFVGSTLLVVLYCYLLLRLIHIAERQRSRLSRVYGYCVVSILFFHILVNIGMVLGMMPVIGIPLPFFSYGGSSLLGFTILLSVFLKFDADRFKYNW